MDITAHSNTFVTFSDQGGIVEEHGESSHSSYKRPKQGTYNVDREIYTSQDHKRSNHRVDIKVEDQYTY